LIAWQARLFLEIEEFGPFFPRHTLLSHRFDGLTPNISVRQNLAVDAKKGKTEERKPCAAADATAA